MGRPWWYDSYWQKGKKRRRGPGRNLWYFLVLLALVLVLALYRTYRA